MEEIITNQYGIDFQIERFPINDRPDMMCTYFICRNCFKNYICKKTIKNHCCKPLTEDEISYETSLKYLMIWLSKKNVTYSSLFDIDFKGFLSCINKKYKIPTENTLRSHIISFADEIKQKILLKVKGNPVSLLIDGVTRSKKKYQGQVIYTPFQLYFLGLYPCEEETRENIAKIISDTAICLSDHNCKLIAVCTDNYCANISALDDGPLSAQDLSNQNFIRFPCSCHTINLAIKDVFDDKFQFIKDTVVFLISYFNSISNINHNIRNVPQFKEVRWFSLFYCVGYIISHSQYLCDVYLQYYNIVQEYFDWCNIYSILQFEEFLIKKLERDCSSLADVFFNFKITLDQLIKFNNDNPKPSDSNIAQSIIDSLLHRFTTTIQLQFPILAFFLTGNGLRYLREKNLQHFISEDIALNIFTEYEKENKDLEKLVNFFNLFIKYYELTFLYTVNTTHDSFDFWMKILHGSEFWIVKPTELLLHKELQGFEKKFASVAIEILSIPCSECAVERVFSHLADLLLNNKRNLSFETLNALLIIRMNSIFLQQDNQNSHIFLNNKFVELSKKNYEIDDQQTEYDPLVNF